MAAAAPLSFDIPEQQCFVYYNDPGHSYHHRVLLLSLGGPGKWICCSTDYDVEVIDLNEHVVVTVQRASPFPARILGDFYSRQPLNAAALDEARLEARALFAALGLVPAAGAQGQAEWYYADTAHEKFGQPVEQELLFSPVAVVRRESVGLVNVQPDGWTTMERVLLNDLQAWKEEKSSGPGKDPRVLAVKRDAHGARFTTVRDALGAATPLTNPAPADWPFRGPSAAMELMVSIRAACDDIGSFHDHFVRSTGLSAEHPVAIKHRDLLAILNHLMVFDQLNVPQLAGAEACARYILQVHQAVKRNPKAPDFRGLAVMTMSRLDSGGGVLTDDFARFVADEQKAEAFTLKQQRLYAEEAAKRGCGSGTADKGGGQKT